MESRMKVSFRRLESGNVDIVLYRKGQYKSSFIVDGEKFDSTVIVRDTVILDRDCGYWLQLENRNGLLLGEICYPDERPATQYFNVNITQALVDFVYDTNIKKVSILNGTPLPRHTQMVFTESANKVIRNIKAQPVLFKSFLKRIEYMNYSGKVTFYQDWGSPTDFYWVHEYDNGNKGMNGGLIWHGKEYQVHT